jgi:hypothetical protein
VSPRPIDFRRALPTVARRLRTALRPEMLFLSACDGDQDRLVAAFEDWCMHHRGAVCDLALSAQWVRAVVAPAAAGEMEADDLRRYAERQLAHYFGDSRSQQGPEWRVAVSEDARAPLVLAAPRAMLAALQDAAARHRVRIGRVVPWWLAACSPRAGASQIVHAREPDVATTIQLSDGRLVRVAVDLDGRVEAGQDACDVQELRLSRLNEPLDSVCDRPEVAKSIATGLRRRSMLDLDLLRSRIRPWRASWALLLAAVVVTAMGEHRRDELLDRLADAQGDLIRAQARPVHTPRPTGLAHSDANEATQADRMQAALDMLAMRDHPWAELFAGLDADGSSEAMLTLAHDAKGRAVDLTLLVPDEDAAWSFAQRLAADSSRFTEASLVSSERLDRPAGTLVMRVRVRAVLKGTGPSAPEFAS